MANIVERINLFPPREFDIIPKTHDFGFFLEKRLDFIVDFGDGVFGGAEPGDRHALFVDDELGEVPLDEVAQSSALFVLHVVPHGVGVLAVDVDGAEHVELDVVLGNELLDLGNVLELLVELVARERQNTQTISFRVLFVHLYQLFVVHVGLSSLGGDVDDDADVSLVLVHADLVAVDVEGAEPVNVGRLGRIPAVRRRRRSHDGKTR